MRDNISHSISPQITNIGTNQHYKSHNKMHREYNITSTCFSSKKSLICIHMGKSDADIEEHAVK